MAIATFVQNAQPPHISRTSIIIVNNHLILEASKQSDRKRRWKHDRKQYMKVVTTGVRTVKVQEKNYHQTW